MKRTSGMTVLAGLALTLGAPAIAGAQSRPGSGPATVAVPDLVVDSANRHLDAKRGAKTAAARTAAAKTAAVKTAPVKTMAPATAAARPGPTGARRAAAPADSFPAVPARKSTPAKRRG
jgi:hypothetical protein